jgi:hypothetical protein
MLSEAKRARLDSNFIEDNNFPSMEYEFILTQYEYPEGAQRQYDGDIYKGELFSKLLVCPLCELIMAVYQQKYNKTPQTYDPNYAFIPPYHPCHNFFTLMNPPLKSGERFYCFPYPYPKYK